MSSDDGFVAVITAPPAPYRQSDRDDAADLRDVAAGERDAVAARRDVEAAEQDLEALERDLADERLDRAALRIDDVRSRAVSARERAAGHREAAAGDRQSGGIARRQAGDDRAIGDTDRRHAARDQWQAGFDELTGARRRAIGLEELRREMDRARRIGDRFVAVFVDADDLKAVNATQGHAAGDRLLCDVVDGLKRATRSYDLIVRLGGDEFLCGLVDVPIEQARARFTSVNAELRAASPPSSFSVGFSELGDGDGLEELLVRADRDLLARREAS